MEVVKNVITRAMPVLTTDVIEELMDHLKHIGVNSIDDMQYLTSEDLDGILPPIQRRRLIQAFTAGKCLLLLYCKPNTLYCEVFCLEKTFCVCL